MTPFGNKIKTLRESQNLTQPDLAELLGISPQFISFLERGQRKASLGTIEKFSQFFNIDKQELIQLSDEELTYPVNSTTLQNQQPELPDYIQKVVDMLLMIEEAEGLKMAEEFLNGSNKRLLNLLKPYNFREVKNEVLNIRSKWTAVNLSSITQNKKSEVMKGCIKLDKTIYFSIEYDVNMMKLVLQADNFSQIKSFEEWIDHHHVSYVTEELIPHITSKQKVVHFFWFSPITSSFDKYNILTEMDIDFKAVDVYDNQLNWLIQSQLRSSEKSQDEDQVS